MAELYNEYFEAWAEKQKMHDLARVFFEKHDLLNDGLSYCMIESLAIQLTPEQEEKELLRLFGKMTNEEKRSLLALLKVLAER